MYTYCLLLKTEIIYHVCCSTQRPLPSEAGEVDLEPVTSIVLELQVWTTTASYSVFSPDLLIKHYLTLPRVVYKTNIQKAETRGL